MTTFAGLRRQAGKLWRAARKDRPVPLVDSESYPDEEILTMLRLLGVAMVETGQPTNLVEADLRAISKAYTGHELRVLVFPTYLIVQLDSVLATKTQIDEPSRATAQLDQAGRIDTLVQLAKARAITPPQVIAQVRAVRSWSPRFGPALTVVGHMILTLGFGLALQPTLAGLPAYALLGGIVGLVLLIGRWLPSASTVLPPLAAIIATVLTTWYLAGAAGDGLLRVLAPALISVLPGMTLAIGAVELTSIQVISGSARLMYGAAQLLLLAFGVVVGARIAGPLSPSHPNAQLGQWAPYLGTVVAALGFSLYKSAPKGALPPIAATMLVALVGQQLGGRYVDPMLAGFFGALVVVPFAQIIARFKGVPPAMVLMLAAFWFLVPGALSFVSVGEVVTTGGGGARALLSAVLAVFSIALGMLFGWGLDRAAAGLVDRLRHPQEQGLG
ncbi:MAG: threonine/serine ThrE exporter family protein [Segniliparus sp.]|uniref:threonine/serine ThrE exporter family protein n=1 Tax=Segniliparus sp. TaxID=2804064 RepID=UPI003F2E6ADC